MPLNEETLGKLTTTLAGDTELYNTVINEIQTYETTLQEKDNTIQQITEEKQNLEARSHEYLNQISNLLSKIPVGTSNAPQSLEAKLEEVKNRSWTK